MRTDFGFFAFFWFGLVWFGGGQDTIIHRLIRNNYINMNVNISIYDYILQRFDSALIELAIMKRYFFDDGEEKFLQL